MGASLYRFDLDHQALVIFFMQKMITFAHIKKISFECLAIIVALLDGASKFIEATFALTISEYWESLKDEQRWYQKCGILFSLILNGVFLLNNIKVQ